MMKGISEYTRLATGEGYSSPHHALLLTNSIGGGCDIRISDKESEITYSIADDQQGIMAISPASIYIERGELHLQYLDFTHLAKLQVFIDKPQNKGNHNTTRRLFGYMPTAFGAHPTLRDIEYWLLNHTLQRTADIEPLCNVLRQSEWYALVDFLFDEHRNDSSQRLQTLCTRYGLSVSHFRRLSRRALGSTTKAALRDWRLGQALLELVEGENNLTTIAMNHGYASLSHFSNDVKDVLGMSPRNLKKILQAR